MGGSRLGWLSVPWPVGQVGGEGLVVEVLPVVAVGELVGGYFDGLRRDGDGLVWVRAELVVGGGEVVSGSAGSASVAGDGVFEGVEYGW